MSRLLVVACALALAAPAFGKDPRQTANEVYFGDVPPEVVAAALDEKVAFDGNKIGDDTLIELLSALAKKHKVTFVLMEEEFITKKIDGIKDRKSRIKSLDAKGLTLAAFLDVALPGYGATYTLYADHIAVVPLPMKAIQPVPVIKFRKPDAEPKPDPKPAKRADATEVLLDVLEQEFQLKEGANVNEIPLFELLQDLAKRHGVTFVINEESFQANGLPDAKEMKPKLATTGLRGLKLRQFLALALDSMGAAYLIKNNAVEIVPIAHAQKVTKSGPKLELDGNTPQQGEAPRLVEPLVSVVIKEKPLNETVAKLAEMYDLTVVVCPQAGDARTGFVSARLLNVPADKALDLLALQADLRVVRRGTAYLVTSKDHASELFNEKLDKERQKVELQKLKEAPAKPPVPPAPPEK